LETIQVLLNERTFVFLNRPAQEGAAAVKDQVGVIRVTDHVGTPVLSFIP